MKNISQPLISYAILVTLFCYLPNIFLLPIWISFIFLAVMGYRWFAAYYAFPLPNLALRIGLVGIILILLFIQYHSTSANGFYIGLLLLFIAMKSLELKTQRDLKVLILCNLYIVLSVLLIAQTLLVFIYVIFGALANLSLMMKVVSPMASFKESTSRILKLVLLVMPVSILLFFVFPRLTTPLWRVPSLLENKIGFSEELRMGNMSALAQDDSTAMKIILKPNFRTDLYWRGLVLSVYDGVSWRSSKTAENQFITLPLLTKGEASYEVLLEPHQKKWLFYQNNPVASQPTLKFSQALGLTKTDKGNIFQAFAYTIKEKPSIYQPLSKPEFLLTTYVPPYGNQQLKAWAKKLYASSTQDVNKFVLAIGQYLHNEAFWYTLSPNPEDKNLEAIERFWFETKRGYCEHYASAVAFILRSVGIPSRIIAGYHGGRWNPLAQYISIQQNDAHAWVEFWQNNVGWQRFDPVSFIAKERIDPALRSNEINIFQFSSKLFWKDKMFFFFESMHFFMERWLLFYNQETQQLLLEKIGFERWNVTSLLQACIGIIIFCIFLAYLGYFFKERQGKSQLLIEYDRLQKQLKHFDITTRPPTTFLKQLQQLGQKLPQIKPVLKNYSEQYESLRYKQKKRREDKAILYLLRSLRKAIVTNRK